MSKKNMDEFWKLMDQYLELCHRGLQVRHNRLVGVKSDVAPILWQNGALTRLQPGEEITPYLYGSYSSISLGYAGLYEAVRYLTGKSHTEEGGKELGLKIMQLMNDKCAEWKKAENIGYSVYGTPIESTTYKFAKAIQRDFGVIPEVTDHPYVTNSYHVNVREEINAFDKLTLEAQFQQLSPGGAVSYVELPKSDMNIKAVLEIIKHMYDTIMYAEINVKADYCTKCGFEGELLYNRVENTWKCPQCGATGDDVTPCRRVCGYIGINKFNLGRGNEIADRVLHM
jgi:ribonucleoside-triphosphate reductase (formate)